MNIQSGDHACAELQRGKDHPNCRKHSEPPTAPRPRWLLQNQATGETYTQAQLGLNSWRSPGSWHRPWPGSPGSWLPLSSYYAHANQLLFNISPKAK